MKRTLLSAILLRTHRPSQLIGAVVGCMLGFLLVMASLQLFTDFRTMVSGDDQAIGSQYLVVNKSVSVLNTLHLGSTEFSDADLAALEKCPAVKRLSVFTTNDFEVEAIVDLQAIGIHSALRTDLFLEAVDDGFLDIAPGDWGWNENQETVPMILPADFINLYNFNYAPSRGLPQLSRGTLQLAVFDLSISGIKGKAVYKGTIAGFSDRINSVLVPMRFMEFANATYGSGSIRNPYRVIVEAKQNELPALQEQLDNNGYETNKELLRNGKFATLLHTILAVVGVLGLLMLFVSLSGFLLYLQLTITRSKTEIEILLLQGCAHQRIITWYGKQFGLIFTAIGLITYAITYWMKSQVSLVVTHAGFELPEGINTGVLLTGASLLLSLWLVQFFLLRKQINAIAVPEAVK